MLSREPPGIGSWRHSAGLGLRTRHGQREDTAPVPSRPAAPVSEARRRRQETCGSQDGGVEVLRLEILSSSRLEKLFALYSPVIDALELM